MNHEQRIPPIALIAFALTALAMPMRSTAAESTESSGRDASLQVTKQVADDVGDVDSSLGFESIYNQGVAQYREGEYAAARDFFTRSTAVTDRALEAKARFNLANCDYAEAVTLREENPEEAIGKLRTAISHYRGAIEANPQDVDARANAELAQLLIDQIEQEQQEQNQDQQNQDEQQQDEQSQDEQQQNQDEQQQDQSQDEQQQDQQNQDQQQQQDEQQQDQSQDQQQQQDEQQQDQQQQQDEQHQDQNQDEQHQQDQQNQDEQQQDQQQQNQDDQQQPQRQQP
ncbi:MAG: hypothetical protein VXZ84_08140, partial [Planctomycetota bacterium]|nr:hypothetical protein [Planctomycetota bacterium]